MKNNKKRSFPQKGRFWSLLVQELGMDAESVRRALEEAELLHEDTQAIPEETRAKISEILPIDDL